MRLQPLKIDNLEVKIPVIQGGMGVGISRSSLAGAVAAAGGVGMISAAQIGYDEPDYEDNPLGANLRAVKKQIQQAEQLAQGGVFGINIMVATKYYEDYVKAAVDAGVQLIVSGAGLPVTLPHLVEGSDTKIAPIVSSEKSAQVILKMWDRKYSRMPDLVVIEGPQAGGHLGFSPEDLSHIEDLNYDEQVRGILKIVNEYGAKYEKKIPVVLAGGIFDSADVAHAMSLGVDGVQVATRFITTKECDASQAYKDEFIKAKQEDIMIVKSPVGMPGRAIRNKFIIQSEENNHPIGKCYQCIKACKAPNIPYCISKALIQAVKGDVDNGLLFCGAKAYQCYKMETVKEIMDDLSNY